MERFICVSRDFRSDDVWITGFTAEDEDDAWEVVEEGASNMSQDWLFTVDAWKAFVDKVKKFDKKRWKS